MLIHLERIEGTLVVGSYAINTKSVNGLCRRIFCKMATSTTTFDFTLTSRLGDIIYSRPNEEGKFNDTIPFLVDGKYTLSIDNGSVDESFVFVMEIEEGVQ